MGRRQEDIQTPQAGTEPPVIHRRHFALPPTERDTQDTGATSTIEVGPLKARGRAADHLLRYGTPALLLVAVSGGIPAVWNGSSDLAAIKTEVASIKADVAELRRLQAEQIASMQVTLARMPTAAQFAADHDEIIQLRATVSACCGDLPPLAAPRRRHEPVTLDATEPPVPEATETGPDAGVGDTMPAGIPTVAKRP
jgi:hypothetical protein